MIGKYKSSEPTFQVLAYCTGGYEVHRTWPLDSGHGHGGHRIASFVCESEAEEYATYRNDLLKR